MRKFYVQDERLPRFFAPQPRVSSVGEDVPGGRGHRFGKAAPDHLTRTRQGYDRLGGTRALGWSSSFGGRSGRQSGPYPPTEYEVDVLPRPKPESLDEPGLTSACLGVGGGTPRPGMWFRRRPGCERQLSIRTLRLLHAPPSQTTTVVPASHNPCVI